MSNQKISVKLDIVDRALVVKKENTASEEAANQNGVLRVVFDQTFKTIISIS